MAGKRFEVLWSPSAIDDLDGVVLQMEEESPVQAVRVFQLIRERARALEAFPLRCRVVPEIKDCGVTAYRELIVSPWRLVFRIEGAAVRVVAVLDGRRDLGDLLLERLIRGKGR